MNHTATSELGWAVLAIAGIALLTASAVGWFDGQYEVARRGRAWFRVTRRWYGLRAHVCFRDGEEDDDVARFVVLAWDDDHTPVPWLQVRKLNPEFCTYWDEDSEAFWAPVTDFAPYTVRRFHPRVLRYGWVPVVWLTWYAPLRQPSGYLAGVR